MTSLERRLGVPGSMAIGIASMLGAGVLYVWTPAWNLAGEWFLLSLLIAAVVATLNGLVTLQLAVNLPVSGGIYSYARHYRSPALGFMAGWFFVTGKTASAGAIALIAANYLWPDRAQVVASVFIAVFTAVIASGIRTAAVVSVVVSAVVVFGLGLLAIPALLTTPPEFAAQQGPGFGVLTAAGLMFFAFAGYARMATLAEEVISPRRTLPLAIVGALAAVLLVYAVVGLALWPLLETTRVAPEAPLTLLVENGAHATLIPMALVAALGSLMGVLAGISRTGLQMARNGDLPGFLSRVSARTRGPLFSEIAVGAVAITMVWVADPLWLVGLSGAGVLSYYAIGHLSALAQPATERFLHPVFAILGLGLCLVLVLTLPMASLIAWAIWALAGILWFFLMKRARGQAVP